MNREGATLDPQAIGADQEKNRSTQVLIAFVSALRKLFVSDCHYLSDII
jgi:hypothetical protein